jgi:hypothetical protein
MQPLYIVKGDTGGGIHAAQGRPLGFVTRGNRVPATRPIITT